MSSEFKTFTNWLFDGKYNTEPPESVSKKSSPVSNLYCISLFMNCGSLNHYLNRYLNNFGIFYIPKDELMKFIKKCIRDFKIPKRNIWYYSKRQKEDKLFDILSKRYPLLKKYEIYQLIEIINKSKDKNEILQGLGLKTDVKKQKVRKKDKKNKEEDNKNRTSKTNNDNNYDDLDINTFLTKNFTTMDLSEQ